MTRRAIAALAALLTSAALAAAQPAPPGADPGCAPAQAPAGSLAIAGGHRNSPYSLNFVPWAEGCSSSGGSAAVHGLLDGVRFTADAEYLMWWVKPDRPALPLLTTGSITGGGSLAAGDTRVLFRLSDLAGDVPYNGGRFAVGAWLSPDDAAGFDVDFFFLQRRTFSFTAGSDLTGSPLLSVPFTDVNPEFNGPSFSQVSLPGALVGRVDAFSTTRLWGLEADFKSGLARSDALCVDALAGFRYVDLSERFGFGRDVGAITGTSLLSFEGTHLGASDSLLIADRFDTRNQFYGGDVGLRARWSLLDKLTADLTAKVALGAVRQRLDVFGQTTHLDATGAVVGVAPGGLFALAGANAGQFTATRFGVIPQATVRLRYAVTDWLSASIGYDFLYWNSVVRPADQVSGTINTGLAPSQVPFANGGPALPAPSFRHTDLIVHGLNCGIELRF
jgi:hypothetical protein